MRGKTKHKLKAEFKQHFEILINEILTISLNKFNGIHERIIPPQKRCRVFQILFIPLYLIQAIMKLPFFPPSLIFQFFSLLGILIGTYHPARLELSFTTFTLLNSINILLEEAFDKLDAKFYAYEGKHLIHPQEVNLKGFRKIVEQPLIYDSPDEFNEYYSKLNSAFILLLVSTKLHIMKSLA